MSLKEGVVSAIERLKTGNYSVGISSYSTGKVVTKILDRPPKNVSIGDRVQYELDGAKRATILKVLTKKRDWAKKKLV